MHGGAAPQVKAAAQRRIKQAQVQVDIARILYEEELRRRELRQLIGAILELDEDHPLCSSPTGYGMAKFLAMWREDFPPQ